MSNLSQRNSIDMHEAFEPFIKRVRDVQSFGVRRGTIQLNAMLSSGRYKADRFHVSIPYAGEMLEWTIMFDSNCPEMGPDFIFHDDSFIADPDAEMIEKNIPSLANWNPLDSDCLLNVIGELALCYKQYQFELLGRIPYFLQIGHQVMFDAPEIRQQYIEVILLPNEASPTEARFVIRLDLDFSSLPGRSDETDGDDATLIISFQQPNWSRVTPQLFLTSQLEDIFGGQGTMHLPPYQRSKCLMDYVNEVKKVITVKMETVTTCFKTRCNFVAALLSMQRRNVVEYDAEDCSRISILLEQHDFFFIVHICLPPGFPEDRPIVNLQSIYHMNQKDELYAMRINEYPYSPRWSSGKIIRRMLDKILKEDVAKFKSNCISETSATRRT